MSTLFKGFVTSIIAITISLGIFSYLIYGESGKLLLESQYQKAYYLVGMVSLIGNWAVVLFERLLNKWLNWQKHMASRFITSLTVDTTILISLVYFAYVLVDSQELLPIEDISIYVYTENIITKLIILTFVTVFIFLIVNLTIFSYNHYAKGHIESVKLTRRQYELQFEALKTQLSPHYLFNCLNTISSLAYINPEQAETYIRKLVQTYQYILETKDKKLVTVAEELQFVNAYKFLLKVRYEHALKLTIDMPESINQSLLPPLTIQMLVENAVKHNDVSEEEPLDIKICLDPNNLITVSNTKNEKKIQDTSFQIGIENIRRRYRYFTENSVKVLNSEQFSVSLPLLDANLESS